MDVVYTIVTNDGDEHRVLRSSRVLPKGTVEERLARVLELAGGPIMADWREGAIDKVVERWESATKAHTEELYISQREHTKRCEAAYASGLRFDAGQQTKHVLEGITEFANGLDRIAALARQVQKQLEASTVDDGSGYEPYLAADSRAADQLLDVVRELGWLAANVQPARLPVLAAEAVAKVTAHEVQGLRAPRHMLDAAPVLRTYSWRH